MIAPTVRPDPAVIWNVASGLALLAHAAGQNTPGRRWVLRFLAGVLFWSGVLAGFGRWP